MYEPALFVAAAALVLAVPAAIHDRPSRSWVRAWFRL